MTGTPLYEPYQAVLGVTLRPLKRVEVRDR
jgi:hypothetical protein